MKLNADEVEASGQTAGGLEAARNRQATYRLFAALFLYPSQDRMRELRQLAREFTEGRESSLDFSFPPELWQLLEGLPLQNSPKIEEEYTALFSVKPKAPPYESYYVDPEGFSRGWIGVNLDGVYTASGVSVSSTNKEPSDHVAVELEFMAYLCSLEAQAIEDRDESARAHSVRHQAGFLDQHLGLWFSTFARKVREASPNSLYDMVARAADSFIAQQLEMLRSTIIPSNSRIPENGRAKLQTGEPSRFSG
ncbi:MAG: molecular chaperone [Anaerolineales bacterium]